MTLEETWQACWELLQMGVSNPKSGFHWPVLGTLHRGGADLGLRTVVLRAADSESRQLVCYTDVRAMKVEDLRESSRCVWHAYDGQERVQLRLGGHATIHHRDDTSLYYWKRDGYQGRPLYQAITSPGAPMAAHAETQKRDTTPDEEGAGYQHFAVITATIGEIDYLKLRDDGQDRAGFMYENDVWRMQWLVP